MAHVLNLQDPQISGTTIFKLQNSKISQIWVVAILNFQDLYISIAWNTQFSVKNQLGAILFFQDLDFSIEWNMAAILYSLIFGEPF